MGTGVLTMPVYRTLPKADVTCLDYSPDMMAQAKHRAPGHVRFVQGDVGNLPFESGSFDMVLSLNGFHAFPDKEAAYAETFRVLKPGGVFCGCFTSRAKISARIGSSISSIPPRASSHRPMRRQPACATGWRECISRQRYRPWKPWPAFAVGKDKKMKKQDHLPMYGKRRTLRLPVSPKEMAACK